MFFTNGHNIKLPRGDSADIKFTFFREDGETPYIFGTDELARLDIFPVRGAESTVVKTAGKASQSPNGSVTISFTPEDTDIPAGIYRYTLRLLEGGKCDTVIGFPDETYFAVGTDCDAYSGNVSAGDIRVTIDKGGETLPPYTGEYTISPSFSEDIVLNTAQTSMLGNITIRRIPVSRTPNTAGGITLTIGGQE